jgi:hypothetical protein
MLQKNHAVNFLPNRFSNLQRDFAASLLKGSDEDTARLWGVVLARFSPDNQPL